MTLLVPSGLLDNYRKFIEVAMNSESGNPKCRASIFNTITLPKKQLLIKLSITEVELKDD